MNLENFGSFQIPKQSLTHILTIVDLAHQPFPEHHEMTKNSDMGYPLPTPSHSPEVSDLVTPLSIALLRLPDWNADQGDLARTLQEAMLISEEIEELLNRYIPVDEIDLKEAADIGRSIPQRKNPSTQ